MTPINEALKWVNEQIEFYRSEQNRNSIEDWQIEAYAASKQRFIEMEGKLKSLLPVEQQIMCDWELFARGYEWDGTHYYDSFQLNPAKYTPTELLQLFIDNLNKG